MEQYTFNTANKIVSSCVADALAKLNPNNRTPLFICVGSDLVLGDSLGPLVGTMLKKKKVQSYIYGTLNFPITAKEIEYVKTYLTGMHPNTISIAIDAAVGGADEIGLIKINNKGLKPGLGLNKNLDVIGNISIMGVVAEKTSNNYQLFNLTRLNLIYKMAECIVDGIEAYIKNYYEKLISDNTKGA